MAKTPTTPEEAQEAIHNYLRRTLQALPEGFALDSSRFGGVGGGLSTCGDGPAPPKASPSSYDNLRILISKSETDYNAVVVKVGEIWRSWGWPVEEGSSSALSKPNRFTRTPDGYRINIEASPSGDTKRPPSVRATSPCFTANLMTYRELPEPGLLTRDQTQDTPPITPTTR